MSNWKKDRRLYSSLVLWENLLDPRLKKNFYHLHSGQSKLSIIRQGRTDKSSRFEKLYGHGYEIRTLATSHSGQWLASACKATTAEHATIHLRDTSNWRLHSAQLSGHSLSITRIAFSPDDQLILSVGRDRSWHLHKYTDPNSELGVNAL